jgi:hypothetical protein
MMKKIIKKNNLCVKLKLKLQKIISSTTTTRSEETIKNFLRALIEIINKQQYINIMIFTKIGGKKAAKKMI